MIYCTYIIIHQASLDRIQGSQVEHYEHYSDHSRGGFSKKNRAGKINFLIPFLV